MFKLIIQATIALGATTLFAQTKVLISQPNESLSVDAIICNRKDMINSNFDGTERLQSVGWTGNAQDSPDQDWRTLLKFTVLDQLRGNSVTINNAKITLYSQEKNYFSPSNLNNSSKLYLINSSWSETSVSWNTQPTYNNTAFVSIPQKNTFDSLEIDVTALSKMIVEQGHPNFGFLHKLDYEDPYRAIEFNASSISNPKRRPKITIEYTELHKKNCESSQPDEENSADAIISSRLDMINSNYDKVDRLQAVGWTGYDQNSPEQDWRILIKFNILNDFLTQDQKIDSAFLVLYSPPNKYFPVSGANAGNLHIITTPWNESEVSWASQPSYDAATYVSISSQSDTFDSLKINITSLLSKMKNGKLQNHGFLYKLQDESPYSSIEFNASNYPIANRRPKIKICASPVVTGAQAAVATHEDIAYPNPVNYELNVYNSFGYDTAKLIDSKGTEVMNIPLKSSKIDISGFQSGIYTLILIKDSERVSKKIVIQ